MKKLMFSLLTLSGLLMPCADGYAETITSTPSPAVSNKSLEIRISGKDLGSTVYCYTWCANVGGDEKSPFGWDDVNTSAFQMTRSNGDYTFTIPDIKAFYSLSDSELENLTKLGFIAKNSSGGQTEDLFIEVVQGRRDAYSGGEGTLSHPFILKTSDDLQELASTPGDWTSGTYFRMEADIDASRLTSAIGSSGSPFCASFDGNGHSITNFSLAVNRLGSPTGLFISIDGGEVKNLGVVDAQVSGANAVGILVGELKSGFVDRCFTSGTVKATSICVGGLVGENVSGNITNCYSGAAVENPSDYAVGGLVGKNRGIIANAYSAGAVSGYDYVGGLVGANYGTIKNSVALNSSVTSYMDFAARFGGNNNSRNSIEQTYSWDDIVAGHNQWTAHGDHATMHPATVFRSESQFRTLTGWDFNTIWEWRSESNKEYPALKNISNQKPLLSDAYFSYTTSVESLRGESDSVLHVGPNPTSGELHIISSAGISEYELYSLNGGRVMKGYSAGVTEEVIDLGGLPEGLYLLRTISADGVDNINKIIKK